LSIWLGCGGADEEEEARGQNTEEETALHLPHLLTVPGDHTLITTLMFGRRRRRRDVVHAHHMMKMMRSGEI
jgi:hypothetical protein